MSGYCPDCGNTLCLCDEIENDEIFTDEWYEIELALYEAIIRDYSKCKTGTEVRILNKKYFDKKGKLLTNR